MNWLRLNFGDNFDVTIRNPDGTAKDLTSFTGATLVIKTLDNATTKLTKTLTIVSPATGGIVRWAIASGDIPSAGDYIAQIKLTGTGLERNTLLLTVKVFKKIGT